MTYRPHRCAPFDARGNLVTNPASDGVYDWRAIEPFDAWMHLKDTAGGVKLWGPHWHTAAVFTDRNTGATYPMLHEDMVHLVRHAVIMRGRVIGRWQIARRSRAYGLQYLGDRQKGNGTDGR